MVKADLMITAVKDKTGIPRGAKITINLSQSQEARQKDIPDFLKIAALTHGFKGHLNSIKGATFYLKEKYSENKDILEYLNIIEENCSEANRLITSCIDSSFGMHLLPVNINEVLRKIVYLTSHRAKSNNVKVICRFEEIPDLKADEQNLMHAFLNIIDNAIEAMSRGGELRIYTKMSHFHKDYDVISITISDTGPGITSSGSKFDGYKTSRGYGLTLTRLILHCHNGWMKINDDKEGTTVKIYLPLIREVKR
jgi:nitrogen-specific signal transduction histidine kinase